MPLGDLLIVNDSGALVVESKTVSDLANSIRTNRLWTQLVGLMLLGQTWHREISGGKSLDEVRRTRDEIEVRVKAPGFLDDDLSSLLREQIRTECPHL